MAFFEIKPIRGTRCIDHDGPPCKRCRETTEVWAHNSPPDRYPHYSRWFKCTNPRCRTSLIMPEKFRVTSSDPEVPFDEVIKRCRAYRGPCPF